MRHARLDYCVFILPLLLSACSKQTTSPAAAKQEPPKPAASKYEGQLTSGSVRPAIRSPEPTEQAVGQPKVGQPAALTAPAAILEDAALAPPAMPKVLLTDELAKSCHVVVGDHFPDLELPDASSTKKLVSSLLGDRLTVVFFWNAAQPTALEELADLASPLFQKFATDGVATVAINAGDSPTLAAELAAHAKASFSLLNDTNRAGFEQVATGRLPRTYLLDAKGTIVWFDLEYSRTTRRELIQAVRYCLAQSAAAE